MSYRTTPAFQRAPQIWPSFSDVLLTFGKEFKQQIDHRAVYGLYDAVNMISGGREFPKCECIGPSHFRGCPEFVITL